MKKISGITTLWGTLLWNTHIFPLQNTLSAERNEDNSDSSCCGCTVTSADIFYKKKKNYCKNRYIWTMESKTQSAKRDWIHPGWLPVYYTVVTVYCYAPIITDTRCPKRQKLKKCFSCKCDISSVVYLPLEAALRFNWPVFLRARAITGFTGELLSGLAT